MEHEQDDQVTVGPGIRVPRHQTGMVGLEPLGMPGMLRVELDDNGRAWIRSITFGEKVEPHQVARVDWDAVAARMIFDRVRLELVNSTDDADPAEWLQRWNDVEASEKRTRRRGGLTQAQKEQVADAFREGGAEMVAKRLNVGVRHAHRYVGQAKEAGLL